MTRKLRSSQPRNPSSGFDVIDLFTLLGVAGIIAAVALPNFARAVEEGRAVRTGTEFRALAIAAEVYFEDHGVYPVHSYR